MPAELVTRTKIVGTIGPASSSKEVLTELVHAGMDGARLNFSHGSHQDHAERARLVREVQRDIDRPLALIADLQGPKLRIGELDEPVTLVRGEHIEVIGEERSDNGALPVLPAVVSEMLQPGHEVLIDDG
ncbi:MAG: pyruvate kinase, partial [Gaiellaceae bacterium]|nr:pyruvate kinase [Gaiellaceae bacterium]